MRRQIDSWQNRELRVRCRHYSCDFVAVVVVVVLSWGLSSGCCVDYSSSCSCSTTIILTTQQLSPLLSMLVSLSLTTTIVNGMKPPPIGTIRTSQKTSIRSSSSSTGNLHNAIVPYRLPHWCQSYFTNPPNHGRFQFANLPTPLYRIVSSSSSSSSSVVTSPSLQQHPSTTSMNSSMNSHNSSRITSNNSIVSRLQYQFNTTLYIKRDDCTHGVEMGGNKIRKLEFLLADAIMTNKNCNNDSKYDSVLTIGGVQSNHCRATACMARMIGLQPYLILRQSMNSRVNPNNQNETTNHNNMNKNSGTDDIGLIGNLLYDRMVGSTIYTCTPGEYGRLGSIELLHRVSKHLQHTEGKTPYIIPVGGSNGLGTWGYINAVDELLQQWNDFMSSSSGTERREELHHIVVACGSGGTAAGIALGIALAYHNSSSSTSRSKGPIVHAIGVCDDADYFYSHIAKIADEMGLIVPTDDTSSPKTDAITTEQYIRRHLVLHQGKGRGYGQSTKEELDFIIQFAQETGIVLDPVYTGKALYNFLTYFMQQRGTNDPERRTGDDKNQNVLFWHTGGGLGLYAKCDDIVDTVLQQSPCHRLDIYGNGNSSNGDAIEGSSTPSTGSTIDIRRGS